MYNCKQRKIEKILCMNTSAMLFMRLEYYYRIVSILFVVHRKAIIGIGISLEAGGIQIPALQCVY